MSKTKKKKTVKPPQTLLSILKLILKGLPKALLWRLPILIILIPLVFLIHTFLLVYFNEGFGGGESWFLDHILCLRGRTISGMLFWFMLSAMIPAIIKGIWRAGGPIKYISGVFSSFGKVIKSFKTAENQQMPYLLGGIAGFCFLTWFWQNGLVNLMVLLFILRGLLVFSAGSFLYILAKCAQNDFRRIFVKNKKSTFISIEESFYLYAGISLGILLTCLPKLEHYGWMIGLICVIILLVNKKKYTLGTALNIIIFFSINALIIFLFSNNILADDGGWQECGGTFDRWIQSEGAIIAMFHGLPPSFAVALGTLLGGAADSTVTAVSDVVTATPEVIIKTPDTPVTNDPNKGWVFSEEYGRLVPSEGAIDSKGRVYRKVPWDESGYAFVDKEESDRLDKMTAAGLAWNRNHGYISPEDAAKYKAQREASRIADRKYHEKMGKDFGDSHKRLQALNTQAKARKIQDLADKARDDWSSLTSQERDQIKEISKNASEDFKRYISGAPITISEKVPGSYDGTVTCLKTIKFINDYAAGVVADVAKSNPATAPLGYAFEYGYIGVTNNAKGISQAMADYARGKGPKTLSGAVYKGVNNGMKATVFDSATNLFMDKGAGKLLDKFGFKKLVGKGSGEVLEGLGDKFGKRLFGQSKKFWEDSAESLGKYIAKNPEKAEFYMKVLSKSLGKGQAQDLSEIAFKSIVKKASGEPANSYVFNPIKANFTK